ncbi:MAG: right-handed parallel beta-helix repeat-containing protein, partial [bacterium]
MKKNTYFLLAAIILSLQLGCENVIYVSQTATGGGSGDDWENACTSITQALNASNEMGADIWVASGQYHETIQMKQDIAIFGGFLGNEENREERNWQKNVTIIDGAGFDASPVSAIDIDIAESSGLIAELNGFTIKGAQKSGIYCTNSSPAIVNCLITNNSAKEGGGIYCNRSSPTVTFCTISDNIAEQGAGLFCSNSSPRITSCVIAGNTAISGSGMYCQDQSFPGLINCTLSDNPGNGIECWSGSFATLLNCIVWNPGV